MTDVRCYRCDKLLAGMDLARARWVKVPVARCYVDVFVCISCAMLMSKEAAE